MEVDGLDREDPVITVMVRVHGNDLVEWDLQVSERANLSQVALALLFLEKVKAELLKLEEEFEPIVSIDGPA